ncbi:hypothetical protein [Mycoplasmopsis cricetuli]|uniref:hypothetical protein n=1 Tax=Mycoplasmopsis cricetuli TaxID=171283 RepID=UPI0012EB80A8|nr:hypothetical protein [Mycoplasmopsis cricetuli]
MKKQLLKLITPLATLSFFSVAASCAKENQNDQLDVESASNFIDNDLKKFQTNLIDYFKDNFDFSKINNQDKKELEKSIGNIENFFNYLFSLLEKQYSEFDKDENVSLEYLFYFNLSRFINSFYDKVIEEVSNLSKISKYEPKKVNKETANKILKDFFMLILKVEKMTVDFYWKEINKSINELNNLGNIKLKSQDKIKDFNKYFKQVNSQFSELKNKLVEKNFIFDNKLKTGPFNNHANDIIKNEVKKLKEQISIFLKKYSELVVEQLLKSRKKEDPVLWKFRFTPQNFYSSIFNFKIFSELFSDDELVKAKNDIQNFIDKYKDNIFINDNYLIDDLINAKTVKIKINDSNNYSVASIFNANASGFENIKLDHENKLSLGSQIKDKKYQHLLKLTLPFFQLKEKGINLYQINFSATENLKKIDNEIKNILENFVVLTKLNYHINIKINDKSEVILEFQQLTNDFKAISFFEKSQIDAKYFLNSQEEYLIANKNNLKTNGTDEFSYVDIFVPLTDAQYNQIFEKQIKTSSGQKPEINGDNIKIGIDFVEPIVLKLKLI